MSTEADDLVKLAPCPCCGHSAEFSDTIKGGQIPASLIVLDYVLCNAAKGGCGMQSGLYETEAEAATAWNTRLADQKAAEVKVPSAWRIYRNGKLIAITRDVATLASYRVEGCQEEAVYNEPAAEVDAPSEETPPTPFVQTFPDHIWLDAGEAMEFAEPGDTFRDLEEVTWSEDNATGFGVKYIRAHLAAASPAEPGGKV